MTPAAVPPGAFDLHRATERPRRPAARWPASWLGDGRAATTLRQTPAHAARVALLASVLAGCTSEGIDPQRFLWANPAEHAAGLVDATGLDGGDQDTVAETQDDVGDETDAVAAVEVDGALDGEADAATDAATDASADAEPDASADGQDDTTAEVLDDAEPDDASDAATDLDADALDQVDADAEADALDDGAGDDAAAGGGDDAADDADDAVTDSGSADTDDTDSPPAGCGSNADCLVLDDGNACNGTLVCSAATSPPSCVVDPATIVSCNPALDTACTLAACAPGTGVCTQVPRPDKTTCSFPGSKCPGAHACVAGSCTSVAAGICGDGNACTSDNCNPALGCVFATTPVDGDSCSTGSAPCVTATTCKEGVCGGGNLLACDDANPCTSDACLPAVGCTVTEANGPCDDGDPCTTGDSCGEAACAATPVSCDDANVCTDDACADGACAFAAHDGASCDDGDACSDADHCVIALCAGVTVDCDDQDPCTVDGCDPAVGCNHGPLAGHATCDAVCVDTQNDAKHCGGCTGICDEGDICAQGACVPIVCTANSTAPCFDGPPAAANQGTCKPGLKTCSGNGTAWLPGCVGQSLPADEDCTSPSDEDCDGKINETPECPPPDYRMSPVPSCGGYCYYDEVHNTATSGDPANASGVGQFATGQLVDGKKGADLWSVNLGAGAAYEWVGWYLKNPTLTFRFPTSRPFNAVVLGLNNNVWGGVQQPGAAWLAFSDDDQTWTPSISFSLAAGTMAAIPTGERGDVVLLLVGQKGRYVRVTLQDTAWTFVDEVTFY